VEPETTDAVTSAYEIGTTHDQCSSDSLWVDDTEPNMTPTKYIPHDGFWYFVDVPGRRFSWNCGGSLEWTTVGTNYVFVRHVAGSRQIDWSCQR
jgi:hypothetical protein